MPEIKIDIVLNAHGHWEQSFTMEGDYEIVKVEVDKFYKYATTGMDKVIEREVAYHDGVAKHTR